MEAYAHSQRDDDAVWAVRHRNCRLTFGGTSRAAGIPLLRAVGTTARRRRTRWRRTKEGMPKPDPGTSLFRAGDNCCAVVRADRAAVLVDAADYFAAFMRAAERAQRSIIVLAWDFDSRTPLGFDDRNECCTGLGDFLNGLARRRRRLRIHVLDWDYPMIFGHDRELPPLYGLGWKPHRRVDFQFDDSHPVAGSHHQKIVVIDDKLAFVGGLDLTSKRWDTPAHRPDDPRRRIDGTPYPPFHDLMIALDGDAARTLAAIARRRWWTATGETLRAVAVDGDPWPDALAADATDVTVGVACTAPAVASAPGIRQVEQLYLDMIARAQRYVYIENQYFTSHTIGAALGARLEQPDGPEIVLVTRLLSHGWLEEMTMHVLRTRLIRELRARDSQGRFHVYYPHVAGLAEGTCVDIHSKAMIVDDEWLRIGSANLSNRSMGLDTECDVVIEAGGAPRVAQAIRGVRGRLLAEHLGTSPNEVARAVERTGTLGAAIAGLGSDERGLRPLEQLPEWSDAVLTAATIADPERPVALEALVGQFAPAVEVRGRAPIWRIALGVGAVLLAFALAWRFTPLTELVSAQRVIGWAEAFAGYWWAPALIMAAYTPASVVMFPRPLITLASVVTFGPWLGGAYAMSGIVLAAVAAYVVGGLVDRDTVRRIAGKKLNRLSHALAKRGLLAITAVRLVPVAPFVVVSLVAGAIRIRLWHLVVGTFIGMLPGVLAATVFGDQLAAALGDPSRINYALVAGVVAALALLALAVRRWLGTLTGQPASAPERTRWRWTAARRRP
jgi:phosphatidylserine/phosphatidylglycerophosphate/cardiolipin synthase-like enzyme/uncharacterized membrane protein YdjX (TVP38/TMEM64 family)